MYSNSGNGTNPRWWQSIFGRSRGNSADATAYSRLALQLHYDMPRESGARSVLLVTPTPCRLGARGALGLANSLGTELSRPVLLIDVCPAKPEVTEILGCADLPGWSDLLRNAALDLHSATLATSSEYVKFLPAGRASDGAIEPRDVLARLKAAQQIYDFVVLFGGAVASEFTQLALPSQVGSVLLLVAENETLAADLDAAQDALAAYKARDVRLVLTSPLRGDPGITAGRPEAKAHVTAVPGWASEKSSQA